MFRIRLLAVTAAAALAACAPTTAGPSGPALSTVDAANAHPVPTELAGYLKPEDLNGAALLGPPPAETSLRHKADREYYLETRALANTPRWAEAIRDNDLWHGGALKQYSCAIGVEIGPQTPATLRVLERLELDVRTIGTPAKDAYMRRRPALGNDLPICVPREPWLETNSSYPSGHSMTGWSWALVLAELAPAKADRLLAIGKKVGDSRAICGVHYISDIEAGRTLGAAMVARLHAEPEFRAETEAARRELARAKASPTGCPG